MSRLEHHISAVRAAGDHDDDGAATRLRLRRSLETRGRRRRQLVSIAGAIAVMLFGTLSWALATGGLDHWWHRVDAPAEPPATRPPAPPPQRAVTAAGSDPLSGWAPPAPPSPPAPPASPPSPPVAKSPRPRPVAPSPAAPVEILYRKAHELHFHGGDVAAALAGWDAYLAAEPAGRFSVEARYNRAICLARLQRFGEAREALGSFARGEVEPAGYRQAEATALIGRIDQLTGPPTTAPRSP